MLGIELLWILSMLVISDSQYASDCGFPVAWGLWIPSRMVLWIPSTQVITELWVPSTLLISDYQYPGDCVIMDSRTQMVSDFHYGDYMILHSSSQAYLTLHMHQ